MRSAHDYIKAHLDDLIAFRRQLHAYPEVSGQEWRTTETIVQRLTAAGLAPHVLPSGTGVVCDLPEIDENGRTLPPTVALRADIDALAMADECDSQFCSRTPGVAHACGHDIHTAAVMGAGLALLHAGVRGVRLIFEPAEEALPGGAIEVIDQGWLDGIERIYGVHCDPKLDVGQIGLRDGALTSASDKVELHLSGPGGHTARPHETVDMVAALAAIATEVPRELETVSPGDIRMVFGHVQAGDAPNVIPAHGVISGTFRTPLTEIWEDSEQLLRTAVKNAIGDTGAEWSMVLIRGVPPVVNDSSAVKELEEAAHTCCYEVVETAQSWGGDSYAWYLQKTTGAYARLGVHDPSSGKPRTDLHSSTFYADDRSIGVAAHLLVQATVQFL